MIRRANGRRLARCLLILAVAAWPTTASADCLPRSVDAFVAAVEGQRVHMRDCRPPHLDSPQPGSGNIPILASAANYVAGTEDSRWVLPWLEGANGWGHNGRESGSTIYEHLNWACALAIRDASKRRGDDPTWRAAGAWLRAGLAKWALSMSSDPPSRIIWRQHRNRWERSRVNPNGYSGPWSNMPGNRHAGRPTDGSATGRWADVHAINPVIAWVSGAPNRRYNQARIDRNPGELTLALWVVRKRTGRAFAEEAPFHLFGVTRDEARMLGQFLRDPAARGDLAAGLAKWLDPYPARNQRLLYRRYASGAALGVLDKTTNGNKGGSTVVLGRPSGVSEWLLPSRYNGDGAATAFGAIEGGTAVATSTDGGRLEIDISKFGAIAWEVVWDTEGARVVGEAEGPPPPPVDPQPSANPEAVRRMLLSCAAVATAPSASPQVRAYLETGCEVLRRIAAMDQAPDRREVSRQSAIKGAETLRRMMAGGAPR
ncbi:MAG: hypothetical protein AAGM22_23665 [Acidobacteriota bacterium]